MILKLNGLFSAFHVKLSVAESIHTKSTNSKNTFNSNNFDKHMETSRALLLTYSCAKNTLISHTHIHAQVTKSTCSDSDANTKTVAEITCKKNRRGNLQEHKENRLAFRTDKLLKYCGKSVI